MVPSVNNLSYEVHTFSREQAQREYLRQTSHQTRQDLLATQSESPRYSSSLPSILSRPKALSGRSAYTWGQFQKTHKPPQPDEWFNAALADLNDIEKEVAEESLPAILPETRDKARKILLALARQTLAPTVYPTVDGEVALYFKSPVAASSVLLVVANDGQGACFSYVNGKSRRARYEDAAELPDDFVREQLRRLTGE